MTLWEFTACVEGFAKANGAEEKPDFPSIDDHIKLMQTHNVERA
jgi:hypothetical protein